MIKENFGAIAATIGDLVGNAVDMAGSAWTRLKGVFSDQSAVDIAVRDPASIERATAAATKLQTALNGANNIDTTRLSSQLNRLMGEGQNMVKAVKSSVGQAQSFLGGQSFHRYGVRLMDTMAAGMKARAQVVVNQIKVIMQQVRNHLPSSPAKVGPLSDIHRLKFGETIAGSINSAPMVKAMRAATAATMMAATPAVAAQSRLPDASQARSALAQVAVNANSSGTEAGNKSVVIHYNPSVVIHGADSGAKKDFIALLQDHKREIKRMMDEETRREKRKKF